MAAYGRATHTHTWYGVHARRGMEAIEAQGILPKRIAVLVHDCWKPYWQLDCVHALCNAHLLRRLREHADEVLLFVTDLSVPFTNNLGERAIRMPKVKQKISGCFRTVEGAKNFAIIRSYLDTLHKQGHNLLDALRLAFQGQPPQPATG